MLAATVGVSRSEWEGMTPAELNIYADAYTRREDNAERRARAHIYSLAALIRSMVWAKHPPSFERIFPEQRKPGEMTDEQMFANVQALNALFGGKES